MAAQPAQPLAAWLRAHGGAVHEALSLTHELPGGGRGVVAQSAIDGGEELIRVPPLGCFHCGGPAADATGASGSSAPFSSAPIRQVQGRPTFYVNDICCMPCLYSQYSILQQIALTRAAFKFHLGGISASTA